MFDAVVKTDSASNEDEVFFCTSTGINGRGIYREDGFVVLKGSVGRLENSAYAGKPLESLRAKLLETRVMRPEGKNVVFQKDQLFGSPSMAGRVLIGRSCNGWAEWKTQDGRTLDEVKRQSAE